MLGIGNYNYKHFSRAVLRELENEEFPGLAPGDLAPDFTSVTLEGEKLQLSNLLQQKNVLLVFGSATCPFTARSISGINDIYRKLDSPNVEILFVYVREAHPGERIPAHRSERDKADAARLLRDEEDMEIPIVVDDVAGSIHRKYSRLPNPAFLVDKSGRIAFRSRWANPRELGAAIDELLRLQRQHGTEHAVVHGGEDLSPGVSYSHLHAFRAIERGGADSVSDFHAAFGDPVRWPKVHSAVHSAFVHPGRILAFGALTAAALAGGLYAGFELRKRRLRVPRNPYRIYEKKERDTETGTDYGAVGI